MLMGMSAESTDPAVVAFGDGDAVSDGAAFARVRRIAGDWRVLLGLLAAAGVAGFTSLVAPWFSMMMTVTGEPTPEGALNDRTETFRLIDIGAFGTAYLPALLVLTVLAVLVVFGPATSRPVARLSGLTLAGALVAVLVAFTITFRDSMERNFYGSENEQINLDSGTGLTTAYVSVVLAGVALFLTRPAPTGHPPAVMPDHSWRPPRPARDETAAEVAAAAPLDLTVQPSRPFARPDSDDDRTR